MKDPITKAFDEDDFKALNIGRASGRWMVSRRRGNVGGWEPYFGDDLLDTLKRACESGAQSDRPEPPPAHVRDAVQMALAPPIDWHPFGLPLVFDGRAFY